MLLLMIEKTEYKSSLKARLYRNSPKGYKSHRISNWKRNFLITGDLEIFYEIWYNATNCDLCNCNLSPIYKKQNKMDSRCLDHCPKCTIPKAILCRRCNINKLNKCLVCGEYN